MMRARHLLAALAWIAAGPALAQDLATIQALNDRFAATFNRGDAAAVAAFYTRDAHLMPPGSEMLRGRAAIESFWKGAAEQVGTMRLMTVEVRSLGPDTCEEIGTFSLMTKGQPAQEVAGKYLVVWRKGIEGWQLDADIWNGDR